MHQRRLFYAIYLNATFLTLVVIALFGTLYFRLKAHWPMLSVIGLIFVPIYGTINLVIYLSQITIIPILLDWRLDPNSEDMAHALLRLTLHIWPKSVIAFFNGFAYAVLGIPSIVYGIFLWQRRGALAWGGVLLTINGIACILGVSGFLCGDALLEKGTMIGGILFLSAMLPLAWGFWKQESINTPK